MKNIMNKPMTNKYMESVIAQLSKKQSTDPEGFYQKFNEIFLKKIMFSLRK